MNFNSLSGRISQSHTPSTWIDEVLAVLLFGPVVLAFVAGGIIATAVSRPLRAREE